MKILSAVFVLACLAASVSAAPRLKIYVSQVERAEVIVQAIVERDADNRAIEVVAESDDVLPQQHQPNWMAIRHRVSPACHSGESRLGCTT